MFKNNRVTFTNDTIELASGFFFNTEGLNDDKVQGRFPFVYYGNKERIRIHKDSIFVYSSPYSQWTSFKKECKTNELILRGFKDTLILQRSDERVFERSDIELVHAHVYDGGGLTSLYKINYSVTYLMNDSMIYRGHNDKGDIFKTKLKDGTFRSICRGFGFIDLEKLDPVYSTIKSEFLTIDVQIGLKDGKTINTQILGDGGPDELGLALVPILYTHQNKMYGTSIPKYWYDE